MATFNTHIFLYFIM